MNIEKFSHEHNSEAMKLALDNYNEERAYVPILPEIEQVPDLTYFAEYGIGVSAFENGRLVGFLCFYPPRDNAFTTNAKGTFCPIHAHGAVANGRTDIYKRMYQAAAKTLVQNGVSSHAVAFYTHDSQAVSAMFTYGFGLRCVDSIRPMELVQNVPVTPYTYRRLEKDEVSKVRSMRRSLTQHLMASPCFMGTTEDEFNEWIVNAESRDSRLYTAFDKDKVIAFIEATDEGENFATEVPDMRSICGAFCLPEYRGKGIIQNVLNCLIAEYKAEGYKRLGVDFESFNPTANAFWLKYFTSYTNSVVRRIDESVLGKN